MRKEVFYLLLILLVRTYEQSRIPGEIWNYVTVRPNAHIFWWLYGAQSDERDNLPLALWLQGSPGGSGTGFGNFEEIGPINQNSTARKTTWIQKTNLLLIDSPVGAGFSYVEDPAAYTRNVAQIANDLLEVLKAFFKNLTIFEDSPFYIFGESYGGKMATVFGKRLHEAIQQKEIKCDFKGVVLGDSLISPVDSCLSWGEYLYQLNLYDVRQHNAAKGDSIDSLYTKLVGVYHQPDLVNFMNTAIRKKLGIIPNNVKWGAQAENLFKYQSDDLLKPVIKEVDYLISQGLKVVVYQGQFDMLCDTVGTEQWINKLTWSGLQGFKYATRKPLYIDGQKGQTQAFVKSYGHFSLYYILNAGLMVPSDNAEMGLKMLTEIINAT